MNERLIAVATVALKVVLFVFFVALVIKGHEIVSWAGLGLMGLGVIGILCLIWSYNRKFR